MKIIPIVLALALLPLNLHAQSNDPPPKAATLFQVVVGGVIVVVGGVAIYSVYKTAKAQSNAKCSNCSQVIPVGQNHCPNCGKAFRCDTCGTKLGSTDIQCPRCFANVPAPKKRLTKVQSGNLLQWTTVNEIDPVKYVFASNLEILRFNTQADFDTWAATETNLLTVSRVNPAGNVFRLSAD